MKAPLISVIMPIYGVEKYLANAVKSILAQTYTNFELILVDDKSPDRCPEMCDELALQDNRIKVIHKPVNEGLGFARNTGLAAAKGEYVFFIDSDDYSEPELLEKALSATDENTEMVIFGINRVHENKDGSVKKIEKLCPQKTESRSSKETADIFVMLNRAKVFPFAWNKLYKKSFLDECAKPFEKTKLIEDFLYNIELFSKASFIKVIPDTLHNYRKPAHETLVSAYAPEFFELCKRKYSLEREFLKKVGGETEENLQLVYFSYVKHMISVFLKNRSEKAGLSIKEQIVKIKEVLNDETSQEVMKQYKPQGFLNKCLLFLLKTKNPYICIMLVMLANTMLS